MVQTKTSHLGKVSYTVIGLMICNAKRSQKDLILSLGLGRVCCHHCRGLCYLLIYNIKLKIVVTCEVETNTIYWRADYAFPAGLEIKNKMKFAMLIIIVVSRLHQTMTMTPG